MDQHWRAETLVIYSLSKRRFQATLSLPIISRIQAIQIARITHDSPADNRMIIILGQDRCIYSYTHNLYGGGRYTSACCGRANTPVHQNIDRIKWGQGEDKEKVRSKQGQGQGEVKTKSRTRWGQDKVKRRTRSTTLIHTSIIQCTHTATIHIHQHTSTYQPTYLLTYIHTYIDYTYIQTYTHTHARIHTHPYTHIIHIHTYIYTYIHTYIHTDTYIHTRTHTYIHTYIHAYIYRQTD